MRSTRKLATAALMALGLLALFAGPASAMKYSLNISHPEGLSSGSLNAGGMATDSAGNVYVGGNGKAEKFSSSGSYLAKLPITGYANDVDVDSAGNVWVAGRGIADTKFNAAGTLLKTVSDSSAWALAVDSAGTLYDLNKSFAVKYDTNGNYVGVWLSANFNNHATDIDIDSAGRVWTAEAGANRILTNNPSTGATLTEFTVPTSPAGIAGDNLGNVWVVEPGFCRVRKYTSTGKFLEGFGECAGIQTPGKFTYTIMPHERPGIAVGPGGVVWVSNGPEVQKWIP